MDLKELIRLIPDYPKPGIEFRDITTLLMHPQGFSEAINRMAQSAKDLNVSKIAGIEARGFIFGAAIAHQLGLGFVPLRKKGKLPHKTFSESYELEYGTDQLEMHIDAVEQNERVLIVDDLIATGGTAAAAVRLVEHAGAHAAACSFVINLPKLGGSKRLESMGKNVLCLMTF